MKMEMRYLLEIINSQQETIIQLANTEKMLINELSQYRSVEQEEKKLKKIEEACA